MHRSDIVIIGAGVIGLAVACRLSGRGRDVIVLERHSSFGQETSSRNSEVIHAGIYYEQGSLKARLCTEGKGLLYSFCQEHKIGFRKTGKLIVANSTEQKAKLKELLDNGISNGVKDLLMLDAAGLNKLEPHIKAEVAIYSASTGIVDSHGLMKTLESMARQKGAVFAYGCQVAAIEKEKGSYRVHITDTDNSKEFLCSRIVINCAGLFSDRVAQMAGIDIDKDHYRLHYCKGEYFRVSNAKSSLVSRLVYPPPKTTALGIHTVPDLNNQLRLGPNDFYVEHLNYDVDSSHQKEFYESAKAYLPFLEYEDLSPDNSGIRPRLQGEREKARDFLIVHETERRLEGFVNLIGIESPGLSASLAIANYVDSLVCDML